VLLFGSFLASIESGGGGRPQRALVRCDRCGRRSGNLAALIGCRLARPRAVNRSRQVDPPSHRKRTCSLALSPSSGSSERSFLDLKSLVGWKF